MEPVDIQSVTDAVIHRIFVEMEASGRHVHLTSADAQRLFGHGLTPERPLSQPGQFVARERVGILGPKGEFRNVAVLGPERKENQVEISMTDSRTLGISGVPVRLSGDVQGSPGVTLVGPQGQLELREGVIVAKRHVHLTPEDGKRFGVRDKQVVCLQAYTDRPVLFEDVVVRIDENFRSRVHLDYDEANACGFSAGDLGRILS